MNFFGFLTFILTLIVSFGAANATEVGYGALPTGEERAADPGKYLSFPNWKSVEMIKEGQANEGLTSLVSTENWDEDISLENLLWLKLKDLSIEIENIGQGGPIGLKLTEDQLGIPFVVDLRYQEKGINQVLFQGTLEVRGYIILELVNNRLESIQVVTFDDSWFLESLGRKVYTIDEYDGKFASSIVEPFLNFYFENTKNLESLMQIAQSSLTGEGFEEVLDRR